MTPDRWGGRGGVNPSCLSIASPTKSCCSFPQGTIHPKSPRHPKSAWPHDETEHTEASRRSHLQSPKCVSSMNFVILLPQKTISNYPHEPTRDSKPHNVAVTAAGWGILFTEPKAHINRNTAFVHRHRLLGSVAASAVHDPRPLGGESNPSCLSIGSQMKRCCPFPLAA